MNKLRKPRNTRYKTAFCFVSTIKSRASDRVPSDHDAAARWNIPTRDGGATACPKTLIVPWPPYTVVFVFISFRFIPTTADATCVGRASLSLSRVIRIDSETNSTGSSSEKHNKTRAVCRRAIIAGLVSHLRVYVRPVRLNRTLSIFPPAAAEAIIIAIKLLRVPWPSVCGFISYLGAVEWEFFYEIKRSIRPPVYLLKPIRIRINTVFRIRKKSSRNVQVFRARLTL